MAEPSATGEIWIDATPDAVYQVVSDPDGLVSVAEETTRILHRRSRVGRVGSRWMGINRNGWRVWPTVSRITDADPGRCFAFEVSEFGIPVSRWQYDLEPADGGVRVTESTWDRRPGWFRPLTTPFTGVADRSSTNTANIAMTLARLKGRMEG